MQRLGSSQIKKRQPFGLMAEPPEVPLLAPWAQHMQEERPRDEGGRGVKDGLVTGRPVKDGWPGPVTGWPRDSKQEGSVRKGPWTP